MPVNVGGHPGLIYVYVPVHALLAWLGGVPLKVRDTPGWMIEACAVNVPAVSTDPEITKPYWPIRPMHG